MNRKKKYYSREFLGITLVPLSSRPRKTVRVVKDTFLVALLPKGKVAIDRHDIFEEKFERSTWLQNHLAHDLKLLGVIDAKLAEDFISNNQEKSNKSKFRRAAVEFEDAAKELGIDITSAQALKISKLIAI